MMNLSDTWRRLGENNSVVISTLMEMAVQRTLSEPKMSNSLQREIQDRGDQKTGDHMLSRSAGAHGKALRREAR